MNEEEFYQYISSGHEQRSVEFKSAGPKTNKRLLVLVVKAALGMANHRDGGIIIIGIAENNGQLLLTGLTPDDLKTWGFDTISDSLAEYADPTIPFDIETVNYQSSTFLVIHIHEFTDSPIICKKSYEDVLRAGACYVRPRRKPETTEPPSHADMQDLLNLAIEKGIRRFISQAQTAGLAISTDRTPTDQDHFNNQIKDFINKETSSELIRKIYSRGYWITRIFPAKFNSKKIPDISSLFPVIERAVVKIRGWYYPHIDTNTQHQIGLDFIGQESEWQHALSSWRFHQSGQFIHLSCMSIDWRDKSSFWPPSGDWKSGQLLGIGDTVATFTEIFELASRLAITDAGDENIHISITVGNLKGRMLYIDDSNRWPLDFPRQATIKEYPIELDLSRTDLIANGKTMALEQAVEFFKRFNFNTTVELLRSWQEKFNR